MKEVANLFATPFFRVETSRSQAANRAEIVGFLLGFLFDPSETLDELMPNYTASQLGRYTVL
jgi:hypothetical protein